jgi:hypothetical protein
MREAAQRAQELQQQAEAARASLDEAAAQVHELERQAAAAQKTIAHYQEHETVFAHALQDAQRASDELIRDAKARAEDAQRASDELVRAANARAEDAQRASDELVRAAKARAEEAITSAKATAEGILRSARNTAADTLAKARESAQEQVEAAERVAQSRSESAGDGGPPNPDIERTKTAAELYLAGVVTKLDAFIHDREQVSRSLEALTKTYADSLQTMNRLKAEVQKEILPTVQRLMHGLKGEDAGDGRDWAQGNAEPKAERKAGPRATRKVEEATSEADGDGELELEADADQLGPLMLTPEAPKSARPATPDRPAREAPREQPAGADGATGKHSGEIVVSPIHSFMQATKFIGALTQVEGVVSVKLRNYAGAKLTIDVLTDGHPVGAIDCDLIDGFPIEVVESADDHLVLRIGNPAARPTSR